MTIALGARPVKRHRSATVMPGVSSPFVSIWILMWQPRERTGRRRQAITQGSCRGVPSLPYQAMSKRSETSVREATDWPTGVRELRISSTPA
jgi:hypothetical protein